MAVSFAARKTTAEFLPDQLEPETSIGDHIRVADLFSLVLPRLKG